jgi:hypothetical protein
MHYRMRLRPGLVEAWLRFPVQDITHVAEHGLYALGVGRRLMAGDLW